MTQKPMTQKRELFHEPTTQNDADHAAELLRYSTNQAERARLVEIARRRGFLLPAHFADIATRSGESSGNLATFSASGEPSVAMSEARVELLAKTDVGRLMLTKLNLKANPDPIPGGETVSEAERNRLLAQTEQGRAVLKRRGLSSLAIERLQHPR